MSKIRIIVKPQACSGCLSCVTTCAMVNEGYVSLAAARLRVDLRPFTATNQVVVCRQCTRALCQEACPTGAISLRPDGAWVIDPVLCNGCLQCALACPFGAIFQNPLDGRVIKCELCGGDPQCVWACAAGALTLTIKEQVE